MANLSNVTGPVLYDWNPATVATEFSVQVGSPQLGDGGSVYVMAIPSNGMSWPAGVVLTATSTLPGTFKHATLSPVGLGRVMFYFTPNGPGSGAFTITASGPGITSVSTSTPTPVPTPSPVVAATGFKVAVTPVNIMINQLVNVAVVALPVGSTWPASASAALTRVGLTGVFSRTAVPLSGTASGTATFTATLDGTGSINATVPGLTNQSVLAERTLTVAVAPPVGASGLTPIPRPADDTFALFNYSGAPSVVMHRGGMPFYEGEIGPNDSVRIERVDNPGVAVPAQFDNRAYRPDGSLFLAHFAMRDDTPLPAGIRRRYRPVKVPGVPFSNVGTLSHTDVTAAGDFTFKATGLTETGDAGTSAVGSGSFTASCAAHLAVPTRREKVASGPVNEDWCAWGMLTDDTGGTADAHLKTNWFAGAWKNADGTIYAREVSPEAAQDWWSVPNKRRRNYTGTFRQGSTVIETYADVQHHYQARWLACQKTGLNRGKSHWIGGAEPTLAYEPPKAFWVACGIVPPLDTTFVPDDAFGGSSLTFEPMGPANHRPAIDAGGAYQGRGMMSNSDCIAFMRQDASSVAAMRINARVGQHVYYHHRSNRQRTRPGDATADTANTVISINMAETGRTTVDYDFTADGLPIPVVASMDGRSPSEHRDGFEFPQGGTGVYSTTTDDPSHAVNYSGYAYILEGRRYDLETACDVALSVYHRAIYPDRGAYNAVYGGGPAHVFAGIAYLRGQERNLGFALMLTGVAAAIIPDSHVAARLMRRYNTQQDRFLAKSLESLPPDVIASGAHPNNGDETMIAAWQLNIGTQGCYYAAGMTGSPGIAAYGNFLANFAVNQATLGNQYLEADRVIIKPFRDPRSSPNNLYSTRPRTPGNSLTAITGGTGGRLSRASQVNGTELWVQTFNGLGVDTFAVPPELSEGVRYFVVNATATDCQISATQGGAPISFAADRSCIFSALAAPVNTTVGSGFDADHYQGIARAALVMAHVRGKTSATQALVDRVQFYMSGPSISQSSSWMTWRMAEPA